MPTSRSGDRQRIALVAGGSGEIGAAVARSLAARGTAVYVGYRAGAARAGWVVEEVVGSRGRAEAVRIDLCDPAAVERVCAAVFDREGALDILVNAAAVNIEAPAVGMDDDAWRDVMVANLDGAFRLCREVAKYMVLGRWGRIVNISSTAARRGGRGQANYAASKAGLEALTRVLAIELGRKGVLVNCVAPGVIESGMSRRVRDEHGTEILQRIPLRRFGDAYEVAEVVAFLCSEEASYVTGQVVTVDGGLTL